MGLKTTLDDVEGQIDFKSVPQNTLRGTYSHYDITRQEDVEKFYPYGDPNFTYTLEYEYAVLSTVVEIKMDNSAYKIKSNILLTLMYDFPEVQGNQTYLSEEANMLFMNLNGLQDVCLAKLEGSEWNCVREVPEIKKTDKYRLQSAVSQEGIYAVILNPIENTTKLKVGNYFIIRYRKAIAIIAAISVVILALAAYIFYRQYRYRSKYKEMANTARDYEKELEEMGNQSAAVLGMTIGDTKEGVVFTDNVSFKKTKDEALNKRIRELERLHEKVKRNLSTVENNNRALQNRLEEMRKNYEEVRAMKGEGTEVIYQSANEEAPPKEENI
ncbi:MAG: hypothetical protein MJ252_06095 [archaeon]|nr:hypothetical protein [archaeon]